MKSGWVRAIFLFVFLGMSPSASADSCVTQFKAKLSTDSFTKITNPYLLELRGKTDVIFGYRIEALSFEDKVERTQIAMKSIDMDTDLLFASVNMMTPEILGALTYLFSLPERHGDAIFRNIIMNFSGDHTPRALTVFKDPLTAIVAAAKKAGYRFYGFGLNEYSPLTLKPIIDGNELTNTFSSTDAGNVFQVTLADGSVCKFTQTRPADNFIKACIK